MRLRPLLLLAAALLLSGRPALARDKDDLGDEVKLQASGLGSDAETLVGFFKNRTLSSVSAEKLNGLIEKLGAKDATERVKAFRELVGLGPLAVPALRQAVSDPDSTTASEQARRCLKLLIGEEAGELPVLAARVLAKQRPKGATPALLAYLPFADSEQIIDEVKYALMEVGHDDNNKPDDALLKAVEDKMPLRRAVAAEVLATRGTAPREMLRKLLADPKPSVRLRAALALAQAKEPKAVSTLIVLLGELPFNQAREAEEYLMNLAAEKAPKQSLGTDEASRQKARDAWAEWWLKSEGPDLLDEFKKRTMDEDTREKALKLIAKLGSETFKERQAAAEELTKMGVLVLPLLRKAGAEDKDPEVRDKAKKCLAAIEKTETGPLSPVTARLVAYRKPEGSAEVLLKFLPFADDEAVLTEVQASLNAVAYEDGKSAPVLVAALTDKLPLRRAAAAEALAQPGASKKEIAEVRKLLKDADATVRMRAALALAGTRDRDAVPMLIDSIIELPGDQSAIAEEYLSRLAGEAAPQGNSGSDADSRKKRSEAWAKWWKDNGNKVRLVSLTETPQVERLLGYTLIVSPNQSRIAEVDKSGKTRWEITNLSNPWDAQVLSKNRLLVLEQGTRRLTERTRRGDILWEQAFPNNIWPVGCQRLSNGNTLLISSNRLVEVRRDGKDAFVFDRPHGDIMQARKLKDGTIIFVTSSSTVHRIDATGKEVKQWRTQHATNQGIHILPNGNVVFPQQYNNRVYEYNPDGQQVWTATAINPVAVQRLPNGNTLISSYSPYQLTEVDRSGKEVWKVNTQVQGLRVYRR